MKRRRSVSGESESFAICVPQASLYLQLSESWSTTRFVLVRSLEPDALEGRPVLAGAVGWDDGEGPAAMASLSRADGTFPVLATLWELSPPGCHAAIAAGALAVISRRLPPRRLASALLRLAAGESTIPVETIRRLTGHLRRGNAVREHIGSEGVLMLGLIASGRTVQEVADQLHLTERTAYRRLRKICAALGTDNRNAALAGAGQLGLLEDIRHGVDARQVPDDFSSGS